MPDVYQIFYMFLSHCKKIVSNKINESIMLICFQQFKITIPGALVLCWLPIIKTIIRPLISALSGCTCLIFIKFLLCSFSLYRDVLFLHALLGMQLQSVIA